MTNPQIAAALSAVRSVFTPIQRVRNDIVSVGTDFVVVASERTGVHRRIPFADLRNALMVTRNGVVVRALNLEPRQ